MMPGLVSYETGLALQDKARAWLATGEWDGVLILLEHLPVITVGNSTVKEHFCLNEVELKSRGIDVVSTTRGGSVTCHNPCQLVGYPVLNLAKWQKDVHWYVRMLEEVLIRTLANYGLKAGRKARYTGVWVDDEKIAAIGVSVRRWVSGHGFALNVNNDLGLFDSIVPCGILEFGVTSMAKRGIEVNTADVSDVVVRNFNTIFQCKLSLI